MKDMRREHQTARGFTLVEMLVVMVVIAILAGIVLSINALVQGKAARARTEAEIKALSAGCESYKADNGSYPQDASATDALDPRASGNPESYKAASLFLYKQLSGDLNANGRLETTGTTPEPRSYLQDFFKPQILGGTVGSGGAMSAVTFLKDPYGNSYGYSTKGAAAEQAYKTAVLANPAAVRAANQGYNPTFDLWSTSGKTIAPTPGTATDVTLVWIKNW